MKKLALDRRTLLRGLLGGAGVSVGLPLLEAMLNDSGTALADGSDLPCRFLMFYWADGVDIASFEPSGTGDAWNLSEALQPLATSKSYVNILTGLQNPSTVAKTHHEGMTIFNGYNYIDGGGLDSDAGGPTIDQLIADRIMAQNPDLPVRSVHTQISKRQSTDGDGGTNAIAISHRGEPGNLVANTPITNPREVWQTLFGSFAEPIDTRPPRLKVIDAVRADAARLRKTLGTEDRKRLDAHLQGIDELQNKIDAATPACMLPGEPTEENVDVGGKEPITNVTQAMSELIAYAFTCDITRVATVMFKRFVSATVFDEIQAGEIHHSASHQAGNNTYKQGVTYVMERFAQLLDVLRTTDDPTAGNLLDSTIVYASTDCSTGFTHSISRQPILLVGHGRGYLKSPGVHYQATPWNGNDGNPNATGTTSAALLTCLQAFDETATTVGGGPGQTSQTISDVVA
ncbi:MAG: DUF1552 domain-containing protein [Myxococcales bacterium]|nr:DUF1552 domain-containing protein [Myxococcales bacterium]